ncbi:MAG: glycosyltransferase family 4 protein [Patescibacteria group bacterium]|nr:glycosyltransferase family 4 protein [Patescibacteria group bacterium]
MKESATKNILLLINGLGVGGAETYFIKQANYLSAQGFNIFFATIFRAEQTFVSKLRIKNEVVSFNFKYLFDVRSFYRTLLFVKTNNIKFVYSTLDVANVVARLLKIFNPRLRVLIRESGMADRKSLFLRIIDVFLNFCCYRIIAVSEEVMNSLVKYQPFYRNRMIVINNGVEIEISEGALGELRKGKKIDRVTLLNVGSMKNENKGQEQLIYFFKKMVDRGLPIARLVLVGEGQLRQHFEKIALDLGLAEKVIFTGLLDREELKEQYLLADIFILYSKNEGCPNAVLEAMSCGLPVISTAVGGINKIVLDNVNGFIIERGNEDQISNAIKKMLDSETRNKMGMAAFSHVRDNFSLSQQTDKLIKLFKFI